MIVFKYSYKYQVTLYIPRNKGIKLFKNKASYDYFCQNASCLMECEMKEKANVHSKDWLTHLESRPLFTKCLNVLLFIPSIGNIQRTAQDLIEIGIGFLLNADLNKQVSGLIYRNAM